MPIKELDPTLEEKDEETIWDKAAKVAKIKEENPQLVKKCIHTFGYIMAYLTMMYFEVSRLQGQKKPFCDGFYYNEKVENMMREIDSIGWDNFKTIVPTLGLRTLMETHYLDVGLGGVPSLSGIDFENFHSYMEGEMPKEEFYVFLDKNETRE